MNPRAQRYLPPTIVIGAALYLAWPPAKPLDLGEELVRATSVRWRADDLAAPPPVAVKSNPFLPVLIAAANMEVEPETGKLVVASGPTGPSAAVLQAGLKLDGIAKMGGRSWAVLNGRARLPGDTVRTDDANRHPCEIVSVTSDHILVRCEGTLAEIRPQPFGTRRPVTRTPAAAASREQATATDVTNVVLPTPLDAAPPMQPPPQA